MSASVPPVQTVTRKRKKRDGVITRLCIHCAITLCKECKQLAPEDASRLGVLGNQVRTVSFSDPLSFSCCLDVLCFDCCSFWFS